VHSLTANVVAANGSDELKAEWLPGCCAATGSAPTACPSRRPAPTSAASAPGRPRRRRVRRRRHQAVDQQRLVRRLLHPLRPHVRRPKRGLSAFVVPADTAA
jgi:hypothetical protein